MDPFALFIIAAIVTVAFFLGTRVGEAQGRQAPGAVRPGEVSGDGRPVVSPGRAGAGEVRVTDVADSVRELWDGCARPEDLIEHPAFRAGAHTLATSSHSDHALLGYYRGADAVAAMLALEALAMRPEDPGLCQPILDTISAWHPWTRFSAMRVLDAHVHPDEGIVGRLLLHADETWHHPPQLQFLEAFVERRRGRGERLSFGAGLEEASAERLAGLETLLGLLRRESMRPLVEEIAAWRAIRVDRSLLASIGAVWDGSDDEGVVVEHPALRETTEAIVAAITRNPPSSVVVVGQPGVGKTTAVHAACRTLAREGWTVFEAGNTELIAGQQHLGQFEARLRTLLDAIGGGRRVVWVVPDFHLLRFTGQHLHSEASALDFLLPHIRRGELAVVGESRSAAFELLVRHVPTVRAALEVLRLEPLAERDALDVARRWSESGGTDGPIADDRTLTEAWQLSQQFQSSLAPPGNLLDLLKHTWTRLTAEGGAATLGTADLVRTLTQTTGLPAAVVDERVTLDLDALQAFFSGRVMGQPEAVDVLVRRISMVKAGVTDPTRPLGVFLFAGPTGTGKTEMAKALAEYLFGSTERLVRLDMSEFQVPESLDPILGEHGKPSEGALVDRIRQQPFSVVLLDEFEKAHPQVWDLFLQTFDDGRLTDRQGRTADFRHAIVVLTTNLGVAAPAGAGLGFSKRAASFDPRAVLAAIHKAFRRELINRIDRVVVFRPLDRATMRAILQKELEDAFERRGLRQRAWAVEWEESAIEFLLEQGFNVDLGARPLKRAIEHHLLAPLAMTIVEHRFPEGDQFLFVRAGDDGLSVEFVDPDVDEDADEAEVWDALAPPSELRPAGIALQPQGTSEEVDCLRYRYEQLQAEAQSEAWRAAKQAALGSMAEEGFWGTTDRYAVLRGYEYRDRIEVALSTAGRLLSRLGRKSRPPRALVARLAQQVYLVEHACADLREGRRSDCFLLIEPAEQTGTDPGDRERFFHRLRGMYTAWARRRRMQAEVLADDPNRFLMAVTGFGAWTILAPEHGLHVEESPQKEGRSFHRATVRVRVAERPDEPPASGELLAQALACLDRPGKLDVVRRYRTAPSPLVRDSVRGWRTGRLDRVLEGDFDLVA